MRSGAYMTQAPANCNREFYSFVRYVKKSMWVVERPELFP
ncbi:hypothetical protein DEV91_12376 [Phyllobacterium brassicacearum]|nr:hypothetical protein DEV91_12376 [Phyllobacterium brassicacearum]